MCVSKTNSPSPDSNASYEPSGKRCRKSFRYHKPSGLCVHHDRPKVNREMPLPYERQESIIPYEREEMVDEFLTPVNSLTPATENTDVFYSPDSPDVFEPKPRKKNKFTKVKNMGVEL